MKIKRNCIKYSFHDAKQSPHKNALHYSESIVLCFTSEIHFLCQLFYYHKYLHFILIKCMFT